MKVVLLAGGLGTRLAEETSIKPKPMVEIGGKPMLWHIMNIYAAYGFKEFYIALGYKGDVIRDYFLNYYSLNSDFTVDLSDGSIDVHHKSSLDWRVSLIDTGLNTMTGGRLKRMKPYLDDTFMLTYGDGLANVNLQELTNFHRQHQKMVTVTAIHPIARFGELSMDPSQKVVNFQEKPQTHEGWINGGFFVMQPEFLDYIDGDATLLEREPLEKAAQEGQLMAHYHNDFWQCMDTVRDRDVLENLWESGKPPWKVWA